QTVPRELIDRGLGQGRSMQVQFLFDEGQLLDEYTGPDYPTYSQAGKTYLGEAADLNHDPMFVQGLEGRYGSSIVPQLTVDIVFYYRHPILARQLDKLPALDETCCDAGGVLKRRDRI